MASKRRNPLEASNASPSSSSEEEADSEQSEVEEKQPPTQQPNDAVEEEGEDESVETEEEEEEDGDDEDDDDDDGDEEEKSSEKKSTVVPSATNPPPRPNSPSGSGSGSDSGSGFEFETDDDDSDKTPPSPNLSDFTIKPIATFKRALETESSGSKNLMSTSSGGGDEEDDDGVEESGDEGSAVNPRLWSPEDEIALLEGMMEYQSKNGTILSSDMDAFHDLIKKSLQVEVSKSQLIRKIRRLKNKFRTNMGKCESGEEPSFSTPHEGKSFGLSKNVWGCTNEKNHGKKSNHVNGSSSSVKNKRKANDAANVESVLALPIQDWTGKRPVVSNWGVKKVRKEDVVGSFESAYPFLNMIVESGKFVDTLVPNLPTEESKLKENISFVESSKVKEWDRTWKKWWMDQAEFHLEEMDLIKEVTELILNARRTLYSESLGDLVKVNSDG